MAETIPHLTVSEKLSSRATKIMHGMVMFDWEVVHPMKERGITTPARWSLSPAYMIPLQLLSDGVVTDVSMSSWCSEDRCLHITRGGTMDTFQFWEGHLVAVSRRILPSEHEIFSTYLGVDPEKAIHDLEPVVETLEHIHAVHRGQSLPSETLELPDRGGLDSRPVVSISICVSI